MKIRTFQYEDEYIEDDTDENQASTQFLLTKKSLLTDLKIHFERYVKTLTVFGFNSARYDIKLIKSYMIPYLINTRDIEPIVIKKRINLHPSSLETFSC